MALDFIKHLKRTQDIKGKILGISSGDSSGDSMSVTVGGLPFFQTGQKVRCIRLDVRSVMDFGVRQANPHLFTFDSSRTAHRYVGAIGTLWESYGIAGENGLGECWLVRLELSSGKNAFCLFYQVELEHFDWLDSSDGDSESFQSLHDWLSAR